MALKVLKPRALPRGGTIAIAAPAFWVEPVRVYAAAERLLAAGYQVTWREDVFARQVSRQKTFHQRPVHDN